MKSRFIANIRFFFFILFLAVDTEAQAESITIDGVVLDVDGKPVSNVLVTAYRDGEALNESRSNESGEYVLRIESGTTIDALNYIHLRFRRDTIRGLSGSRSHRINKVLSEERSAINLWVPFEVFPYRDPELDRVIQDANRILQQAYGMLPDMATRSDDLRDRYVGELYSLDVGELYSLDMKYYLYNIGTMDTRIDRRRYRVGLRF